MKEKGAKADIKLVASWLDRLIMALENVTPTIELIDEEVGVVSDSEGCCECCCGEEMPKAKKAVKAKPKAKAKKRK
jgi:hypothetical protein